MRVFSASFKLEESGVKTGSAPALFVVHYCYSKSMTSTPDKITLECDEHVLESCTRETDEREARR